METSRDQHRGVKLDRALLCRPRGGLNDTLCQIERCFSYATQYGRVLIIDASRSFFHGRFSEYFRFRMPAGHVLLDLEDDVSREIDGSVCLPQQLGGRLGSYVSDWAGSLGKFIDRQTGVPITFDFGADHAEPVLVHEQCGGGTRSFDMIQRLTLSLAMRDIVRERLAALGRDYFAVHVRNTDLKTDYSAIFADIAPELAGHPLLICSDDASVIAYGRQFFRSTPVLVASDIPDTSGRPLHERYTFPEEEKRRQAVGDALVDLFALAFARRLFLSRTEENRFSGFSRLAHHLHGNREILYNLLNAPIVAA